MPKISIVIPTYNRGYMIDRAINSVKAQDVSDWELFVVDDGGTDNTEDVVAAHKDSRIKYIKQNNAGPGPARNTGMDASSADIIAYLDSDDIFLPGYLSHVLACGGRYGTCKQKRSLVFLNPDGSVASEKPDPNNEDGDVTLQDFYDWKVKTTSSGLFHRRGYKSRWRVVRIQDLDFMLQLGAEDPEGFAYIPHRLVDYRQSYNGDGLCSQATYASYAQAFGQIYEWNKDAPLMKNPDVYLGRVKKYTELQARVEAGLEIPPQYKYFPELFNNDFLAAIKKVLVLIAFIALASSPAAAAEKPTYGKLAYVVKSGKENHIYTMHSDGSNAQFLTNCLETECYPSWSPDGKKIAFQRQEDGAAIFVMNADGTNQVRLSPPNSRDVRPSWSPDGTKIIFTYVVKPTDNGIPVTDIVIMDADGTNRHTIVSNGAFNIQPRWSPTEPRIVFMSGLDRSQQIYTVKTDGNDMRKITSEGISGDPAWSPDGKRISFGSNREGDGKLNIFTMNGDGSDVVQITNFLPPYEAGDTSWSPDGRQIAFQWDVDGKGQSDPNVLAEVWIVNADGTNPHSTKIRCASVGCAPRWQPVPAK